MSKLNGLYSSILRAAGLVADSEGYVSLNNQLYTGTPNTPALIGGKRIVLPTDHHLRNPSSSTIVFHPLREQAMRGESETVGRLRNAIGIRLNFTFQALMNEMLQLAKNRAQHKLLDPQQAVALMSVKDATENTHVAFTELILRSTEAGNKPFVSIYVKKSATIKERNYFRAGIVTFPMYEELKDAEKPLGYAISEKERKNLLRLMEFVIPDIQTPNSYDRGSNSGVAPHLDALMKAFGGVASRLNDQIDLFDNVFKQPALRIDDEWVEAFEDLDALQPQIQMIPSQPGNEGTNPVVTPKTTASATPTITPTSAPMQASAPLQAVHPQAVTKPTTPQGPTVSFDDLMKSQARPQVMHVPVFQPPPMHPYPQLANYPGMPVHVPGVGMVSQQVIQQQMHQPQQAMNPNGPRGNWGQPPMNMGYPGQPQPGGFYAAGGTFFPVVR